MLDELRTFFEDFVPREHVEEQWVKRDRSAHEKINLVDPQTIKHIYETSGMDQEFPEIYTAICLLANNDYGSRKDKLISFDEFICQLCFHLHYDETV